MHWILLHWPSSAPREMLPVALLANLACVFYSYKTYEAVILLVVALHIVIPGTKLFDRYFYLLKKIYAFALIIAGNGLNGVLLGAADNGIAGVGCAVG